MIDPTPTRDIPAAYADPGSEPVAAAPAAGEQLLAAADAAANLAEVTEDLQRVQAEYINYRRRVDRDRQLNQDRAVIATLQPLLPILDDIDRARSHGELEGGFKAVADRLVAELTSMGLARYGEAGDTFDPRVHAALVHLPTGDVTEPVCLDVVAPGYTYAGQIVRPAQVAVATPA